MGTRRAIALAVLPAGLSAAMAVAPLQARIGGRQSAPAGGAHAAAPASWSAPVVVDASGRADDVGVHYGTGPLPVAAWSRPGRPERHLWSRRRADGRWTPPRELPGDGLGGVYGVRHAWTFRDDLRGFAVRRGALGGRFGPPFRLVDEPLRFWLSSTTAAGAVAVAFETIGRRSGTHRLWLAIRRPRGEFRHARLVWPHRPSDFDVALNDRGIGVLAWASRRVVYAARISQGRIHPARRLAATAARVPVVFADVDAQGGAVVAWLVGQRREAIQGISLAPSTSASSSFGAERGRVTVRTLVHSPPVAAADPGGGIVAWERRSHERAGRIRLWASVLRRGRFGSPRPLSPADARASWIVYSSEEHGTLALLWREGPPGRRLRRPRLYAALRTRARWLTRRIPVSPAGARVKDEVDVFHNPCTGRPTALWVQSRRDPERHARRTELVAADGPRIAAPVADCHRSG